MAFPARAEAVGLLAWLAFVGPRTTEPLVLAAPDPPACIPVEQCCKVCDKGYACGNTCISRSKQCHKGRGCACNASEVCGAP